MPSSPLHAAFPEHPLRDQDHDGHVRSGSGIGNAASRTRRLQLRNAGFRGPAMPSRKVTPKSFHSISTSSTTSAVPGSQQAQSSGAENVSPSGRRAGEGDDVGFGSTRPSSGILQEIGNSSGTVRQTKRARPRVTSSKFWSPDVDDQQESIFGEHPGSSPTIQAQLRPRSVRKRAAMGTVKSRRSVSAETRKYIDHLELELQSAQAQVQAVTSPSITREQSATLRHVKAESRQLQEELAAWESKYEERVQDEMQKHFEVEAGLRSKIRAMEQEADDAQYRMQELQCTLETATQSLDMVETANVNLEKRLEIMSELLAASPTKIDLHAKTPGRSRQARPKSMIQPRFPTAGSLMSPERPPQTQPPSPSPSQVRFSPGIPISPMNLSFSPEVSSSDEDLKVSDAPSAASTTGVSLAHQKTKPMRRMRRFGAGSIGPKPLILPSTSHCEEVPASAPALDNDEFTPSLPFSRNFDHQRGLRDGSPISSRRRASSEIASRSAVRLAGSTFPDFHTLNEVVMQDRPLPHQPTSPFDDVPFSTEDDALLDPTLDMFSPHSGGAATTTRNFDSLGSAAGTTIGRNLMDELTAARMSSSIGHYETSQVMQGSEEVHDSSPFTFSARDDTPLRPPLGGPHLESPRFVSNASTAVATIPRPLPSARIHHRASSKSLGVQSHSSLSTLDSLRDFFGDVFSSPVAVAKYLVERAQTRMLIPRSLLNIQWWLVGVLIGPMAKKRLLAKKSCCGKDAVSEQQLLEDSSASDLEYGTLYMTPPASSAASANLRHRNLMSGKGKKRTRSISKGVPCRAKCCPHHQRRYKHSPWLWLKFSMTLAIAVGVAFKDGPSTLLKDAICQCKRTGSGNWRKAKRDAIGTPSPRGTET